MAHATSSVAETEGLQSLAEAKIGIDFQIRRIEGPGCEQLRRLGFCESLYVRKLTCGRNLICSICGTRLAVSRILADQIKVVAAA